MYKKFVLLLEKRIRKILSTCQKRTAVINVFIFNKLDFQNWLLTILTLKLFIRILKAYLNHSFKTVQFLGSCLPFGNLVSPAWAFYRESEQDSEEGKAFFKSSNVNTTFAKEMHMLMPNATLPHILVHKHIDSCHMLIFKWCWWQRKTQLYTFMFLVLISVKLH